MIGKTQVTKNRVSNKIAQAGGNHDIDESHINDSTAGNDLNNSYEKAMTASISKIKKPRLDANTSTDVQDELGKTKRSQMLLSRIQKLLRAGVSPFDSERDSEEEKAKKIKEDEIKEKKNGKIVVECQHFKAKMSRALSNLYPHICREFSKLMFTYTFSCVTNSL